MATAPVQLDEESLIKEIVSSLELPSGVRFRKLALGLDSEGFPVWDIYFAVSKKIPLTKKFLATLSVITTQIVRRVADIGTDKFPLVHFNEAK